MSKLSNLKSRLMLLVLITLVPVVLLILYSDFRHRRSIETGIRNDLARLSFFAKDNLNGFFDTTGLLLLTLSQTEEVQRGSYASISVFFRNLLKNYPDYANIGMADLKGNLVCSALPMTRPINSSDLAWFRQAVRTRDFSIGEYQIGRIAGVPVLVLSRPVFDEAGKMKALLYLSVKLTWLKRLVKDVRLTEGYALVITDLKGAILTRHPEPGKWTGKLIPEAPLINAMLRQKSGFAEIAGLDGVQRIYAFSTAGYGGSNIPVAVGMSKKAAFKESNQNLLFDLLLLAAAGGAGLVAAHRFCHAVILRPVSALKQAAENLARGDFSSRTNYTGRVDELGSLAGLFDSMAQAVEKEIAARKEAVAARQEAERHFRETLENVQLVSLLLDLNGCVTFCNDFMLQLTGYSREEVVGRDWFMIFVPEARPDVKEEFLTGLRTGEIAPFIENPIRTKNGAERLIRFSNTLLRDGQGQVIGTTSIGEDITERKKAEEEIRAINEELVAINRVITAITRVSNINEILENVLDEALGLTGLEGGTICMVTPPNTLQLASHRATSEATILDLTANEIKVGDCLCGECARDRKPLILWDREAVLKFATREATRGEDIRFHAAFPLVVGSKCLGVLCVFTRTDRKPEERRLKLIETVTAQIALAVQNAGLLAETLRNAAILEDVIKERTAELEAKIAEIERMNRLFVGRELKMAELKERIRALESGSRE